MLEIRVGIHAGEAIQREHDLIGVAVATTSRICNVATAGEVIVSEAARQLVPAGEHAFEDRGRFGLKGLSDFVRLYCAVVHTSH